MLTIRNIGYQCRIGISALLGEATMGVLMLMGNLMFMRYMGDKRCGCLQHRMLLLPLRVYDW